MRPLSVISAALALGSALSGCSRSGVSDHDLYSEAQANRQYNEKALEKMELPPGDGPSDM
jgi:hypothetical protein